MANSETSNISSLKRPKKRSFVELMSDEDIVWLERICNEVNTAEEQIPLFIREIEAESAYHESIVLLCKDFQDALKSYYRDKNIKIIPFGSAVMNLALKNSDVDLFLDFGGKLPSPVNKFAKTLKGIMYQTGLVRKACAIIASVPIVKCETLRGITCDISFLNKLGVMNSKLIHCLLQIDNRSRPLILVLKFLLQKKGVIAKSGLTSFTLIMLTIFFLQQLKLLPSVKELQDLSTTKDIIAGWNTAFSTEIPKDNLETQCDYSVVDLLIKFFKFYAEFEFAFYVISTFTGKAYLKPIFDEIEKTPEEFSSYKENVTNKTYSPFELDKFMCVQDPFYHSRNIARSISQAKLIQFQCICEESLEICQEELQNNKTIGYKSKFLKNLFSQSVESHVKKKLFNQRVITVRTDKYISHKYFEPCSEDILRNNWSKVMAEKVINILTKILLCKVNEVSNEKHDEISPDLKSCDVVAVLRCEFKDFYLVSRKRHEVRQTMDLPGILDLTDREVLITKNMCEKAAKANNEKPPYKFEAVCFTKKGPTCFCVSVESQEESGIHKQIDDQFLKFLKYQLPKLLDS